jgi:hypothetical protein
MKTESKLAKQKKAARAVAEIMYLSLQQFSEDEQERRIEEIHRIAWKADSDSSPKYFAHPKSKGSTRFP